MDHDGRNAAALQADTALAATIVKSIDELERNHRLAEGPLSEKLMRGIEATMRAAAPEPWEVAPTEWSILLRVPEWKPTRGLGNGDAWIQVNEVSESDLPRTWLGVATGAGGNTQLGLELVFRNALKGAASVVTTDKAFAEHLAKIGFRRNDEGRVFLPIVLDKLRLAKAYGENDVAGEALLPVRKAVEAIVAAKADLDKLIEAVRIKAKAK